MPGGSYGTAEPSEPDSAPCARISIARLTFCLLPGGKGLSLIGSWVNKTYKTTSAFPAKVVFDQDGVVAEYQRLSNRTALKAHYVIQDSWTEPGVHWFKVKETMRSDLLSTSEIPLKLSVVLGTVPQSFATKSCGHSYYTIRHRE